MQVSVLAPNALPEPGSHRVRGGDRQSDEGAGGPGETPRLGGGSWGDSSTEGTFHTAARNTLIGVEQQPHTTWLEEQLDAVHTELDG